MTDTLKIVFGISFIFLMTTLGSSVVFFFRKSLSENIKKLFLGFASGIMIAASIWSLLIPGIDMAVENGAKLPWIPAAIGFLIGGLLLLLLDKVIPHIHMGMEKEEGPKNKLSRTTKLFFAVTLHNIPEGLAVGLAFGLAIASKDPGMMYAAVGLAVGIGLQNFPEGAALSLPLKEETGNNKKAFLFGTMSGVVEPIAAVVGLLLATQLQTLMPWFLAIAAGAMIYVVVEELIPESHLGEHSHFATWGVMAGFVIMMVLDIALG